MIPRLEGAPTRARLEWLRQALDVVERNMRELVLSGRLHPEDHVLLDGQRAEMALTRTCLDGILPNYDPEHFGAGDSFTIDPALKPCPRCRGKGTIGLSDTDDIDRTACPTCRGTRQVRRLSIR